MTVPAEYFPVLPDDGPSDLQRWRDDYRRGRARRSTALAGVSTVIFLGVVENGLTLSNVSSFWQGIVSGSILIIAVGFGVLRERGWSIRRARGANAAVTEGPVR